MAPRFYLRNGMTGESLSNMGHTERKHLGGKIISSSLEILSLNDHKNTGRNKNTQRVVRIPT